MKLCAKGFPNRLRNGREKREYTDRHTHRHFRIYISRIRAQKLSCNEYFVLCDSPRANEYIPIGGRDRSRKQFQQLERYIYTLYLLGKQQKYDRVCQIWDGRVEMYGTVLQNRYQNVTYLKLSHLVVIWPNFWPKFVITG